MGGGNDILGGLLQQRGQIPQPPGRGQALGGMGQFGSMPQWYQPPQYQPAIFQPQQLAPVNQQLMSPQIGGLFGGFGGGGSDRNGLPPDYDVMSSPGA